MSVVSTCKIIPVFLGCIIVTPLMNLSLISVTLKQLTLINNKYIYRW